MQIVGVSKNSRTLERGKYKNFFFTGLKKNYDYDICCLISAYFQFSEFKKYGVKFVQGMASKSSNLNHMRDFL